MAYENEPRSFFLIAGSLLMAIVVGLLWNTWPLFWFTSGTIYAEYWLQKFMLPRIEKATEEYGMEKFNEGYNQRR